MERPKFDFHTGRRSAVPLLMRAGATVVGTDRLLLLPRGAANADAWAFADAVAAAGSSSSGAATAMASAAWSFAKAAAPVVGSVLKQSRHPAAALGWDRVAREPAGRG